MLAQLKKRVRLGKRTHRAAKGGYGGESWHSCKIDYSP